jgi:hypothetical protein
MSKRKSVDFWGVYYGALVDKMVVGIVTDEDEGLYGLRFDDGTIAWIAQDEEVNGPGFLAIQKK